jgi:hypothetical protein
MATRMQQRRGTAQQWTTADPILNAGEIGFESDTNKFKVGDGINHWADLTYFVDEDSLSTSLGDYIETSLLGAANGVAQLNSSGLLVSSQIPNIDEITQDAINTAIVAGTGLDKTYNDNANTITLDIDSTVATKTFAAELLTNATKTNITITGDSSGLTIAAENGVADSTTDNLTEGSTNKYFTDERAQDAVGNAVGTGLTYTDSTGAISVTANTYDAYGSAAAITPSTLGLGDVDNTSDEDKPVSTATQTALDLKANLAGATFTGDVTVETNLTIDGDLTVSGTTTTVSAQDLVVTDPLIYIGEGNLANIVDLGFVANFNDGTYQHSGLVRDSSAGTWKLFKGVTDEPTTTVNFAQGSLDDLAVGSITAIDATFTGSLDVSGATITGLDLLPDQSGNTGKYLTTDGTSASWAVVEAGLDANMVIMGAF